MKRLLSSNNLFLLASALCLLTFQFARALTSVSIGLLLISAIWAAIESPEKRKSTFRNPLFLLCALFFFLLLLDGLKQVDHQAWSDELVRKSGIFIIPFAVLMHSDTKPRSIRMVMAGFAITMAASAGASSINYFLHMDEINPLLLQSKHVPLIADVHHIYFGLFLAVSTIVTFWLHKTAEQSWKKWWLIVLIIEFVSLHILSSRTGLISFYAGVYLMALIYIIRSRNVRLRLGILAGLILLPVLAVLLSPSLRHKISNTREDLESIETGGDDINFKSFAMRMEAWKMSIELIKEKPLQGVGATNLEAEMAGMYEEQNTQLYEENRVGPHNQILESTIAHGIIGGLVVLAIFLVPFGHRDKFGIEFAGIWAVLGTAMLVESVFERQLGIVLFGFFYFLSFLRFYSKK